MYPTLTRLLPILILILLECTQSADNLFHSFTIWEKRIGNFFRYRITNRWNNLCDDVVTAPSLNSFKSRLDHQWCAYKYSNNNDFPPMRTNIKAILSNIQFTLPFQKSCPLIFKSILTAIYWRCINNWK